MTKYKWWQTAIFYQIYPRSFADSNGDGIGDLPGITQKLDYLKGLGVNGLWLSPHYPSPGWDCGYDVSDYEGVAPEYGTLDDFKSFLSEAHTRGMHVILDLVLNHSSDQHAWFIESKSSRDNPKADWYVWHDSALIEGDNPNAGPPNNWQSCFDGPAWTYVPERDQYFYHYFMKQQPDLNWRNIEVKRAMWRVVRFWLDLGVDGFRLDALGTIFEDPALSPHSVPLDLAGLRHFADTANTSQEKTLLAEYKREMFKYQWGGPGLHELMKELRCILKEYSGDRLLVGEDDNIDYMGDGNDELQLVFNFPLMHTERISPAHVRTNQKERLHLLDALPNQGWGCNTLGNHDCSRMISRYGDGHHNDQLARLHLALLLTMRGTPFLYNGEEIGMSDLLITNPSDLRDTMATWYYGRMVFELRIEPLVAAQRAGAMSRDKNRTPFQWRNTPQAGFCPDQVSPWLPVNPNYSAGVNVEDQEADLSSMLIFYRRILNIRNGTPALIEGEFKALHETSEEYLAFLRISNEQTVLVVLNFSERSKVINFSDLPADISQVIFTHGSPMRADLQGLDIGPYGIFITTLK